MYLLRQNSFTVITVLCLTFSGLVSGDIIDDYRATVLADGPVRYYQLEDTLLPGSGDTIIDSSVSGINGTEVAAELTAAVGGQNGISAGSDAFDFGLASHGNNGDAGFSVGSNPMSPGPLTIEFWIKQPPITAPASSNWWLGIGVVDAEVGGVVNDYGTALLEVGGQTRLAFGIGGPDTTIYSTSAIDDDQWHHVVAVWTRQGGTNMFLYIDGQVDATGEGDASNRNASTNIRIGELLPYFSSQDNPFEGLLDEIALYNKALTDVDVSVHYAAIIGGTVGITNILGSSTTISNRRAMPATMPEDGQVVSISMFHGGGSTGDMILAIYDDNIGTPGNLLAVTAETLTDVLPDWQTIDLISPIAVPAGTAIWLAWVYEDNPGITYDTGSPGRASTDPAKDWGDNPKMPATFGSSTIDNYRYSIYANYIGPADETPPDPNRSTWAQIPEALSATSVHMAATTAVDPSGVEYYFQDTSGNPGADDSDWQDSNIYTDTGLTPETTYTYQVKTRDKSALQNGGTYSTAINVTTPQAIVICPEGDLDGNCFLDIIDLRIFAGQWLDAFGCIGHPDDCADFVNQDGVNMSDFSFISRNWLRMSTLYINEIMASNNTTIADPQGDYDDWIEIYNPSDVALDIGGMYLEDNSETWQIPADRPAETTIDAYSYLLIWADEDVDETTGLHAPFKLNAGGDSVTLINSDGETILDSVSYDSLDTDISLGKYPDGGFQLWNMSNPTPGSANDVGRASDVKFHRDGGTFTGTIQVQLSVDSPTAEIYYTTDKSEPTSSSTLYTGPITIGATTWLRARAYDTGLYPGAVSSESYLKIDATIENFSSHLPIVVIDSFNVNIDAEDRSFHQSISAFIDTDDSGIARITDLADWAGYGGMHMRGNSSAMYYDKKQYRLELWDEKNKDTDASLLGLPEEADWILHAPYSDKTLMRNYQMYAWNAAMGRYGVRCRFFELFLNDDGDSQVTYDDYQGLYVLMEKIEENKNRLDIGNLESNHDTEPEITGGYVLKIDWPDTGITTAMSDMLLINVDPDYESLTQTQRDWLTNHFNAFETVLFGPSFDDPVNGYAAYIDVPSFIDYHIITETANNIDGFIFSAYFYKEKNGKINMGPIWDFNGSLGGANYGACSYIGWRYSLGFAGYDNVHYWYDRLFVDPEFLLKYADRWFDLREDTFATANMLADIDSNADLLTDGGAGVSAVTRNFDRWPVLGSYVWPNCVYPGTYQGNVDEIKTWLSNRLDWMDMQIEIDTNSSAPPDFELNNSNANTGGNANPSDTLTMIASYPIYYTTDGTDPREFAAGIAASATLYSGGITLTQTTQFKARIKNGSQWSALNEATFAIGPVADSLRITELMYHPVDPNDEFIELKNTGAAPINLALVKFTDGIDFTFPSYTLNAGDYVLVIKNQAEFEAKYGTGLSSKIAGEYSTTSLSNGGERITLEDAAGAVIQSFGFKDGWYQITDGYGFSLNIINASDSDPNNWEYKEYWQPSGIEGGTPGSDNSGNVASVDDLVINELLAHSDFAPNDWVELYNTSGSSIDISGWFLSDKEDNLKRHQIGTKPAIAPGGYLVLTQDDDFGGEFGLSELGETVYLSSGSSGELSGGYCVKEDFKASDNGITFGRHIKSAASGNDVDFVSMSSPSSGSANNLPLVGPVVISEIMYHHSTNGYAEYVELTNISGATVSLDNWKFSDEDENIDFTFPPGTSLLAGAKMLLIKSTTDFNNEYGSAVVTAIEWGTGRLNNSGEKIEIAKPGAIEPDGTIPYYRVDRINYSDGSHPEKFHELPGDPWPTAANGNGSALDRKIDVNYGNDVDNWQSASPSPGL